VFGSDVRITLQHALLRTSEPKGHQQLYDSSGFGDCLVQTETRPGNDNVVQSRGAAATQAAAAAAAKICFMIATPRYAPPPFCLRLLVSTECKTCEAQYAHARSTFCRGRQGARTALDRDFQRSN
jgi:hypothetical protein